MGSKKQTYSRWAVALVLFTFCCIHFLRIDFSGQKPLKISTWDALGYYAYLPALVIYHDCDSLSWYPAIEKRYQLQGDEFYQFSLQPDGKYTGKYFVGVALMQAPFFLLAHMVAAPLGYPADGFSFPYQFMIGVAALFYAFVALLLTRKVLLRYYDEWTTGVTLLLAFLATNVVQYVCLDSGQSHVFIMPLYALMLVLCIRFYEVPSKKYAFLIGLTIGLAAVCRPTELIILFLPLLWVAPPQVKHIALREVRFWLLAGFGAFLALLPQLLYWKHTTGSWVYDVGSKWDFLNPHFRVLLGWEKGWFIYTPVTVLFIAGLFFLQGKPFRAAVITFSLLNIWIVIAWSDWRYGGSYSCRALMQSTPVWTLSLAGLIRILQNWKWHISAVGTYLGLTNLFQIYQYQSGIIHHNDMNRQYYQAVYWNMQPSPLQFSLLDSNERPAASLRSAIVLQKHDTVEIKGEERFAIPLRGGQTGLAGVSLAYMMKTAEGAWGNQLLLLLRTESGLIQRRLRIDRPRYKDGVYNSYELFVSLNRFDTVQDLYLQAAHGPFQGKLSEVEVRFWH